MGRSNQSRAVKKQIVLAKWPAKAITKNKQPNNDKKKNAAPNELLRKMGCRNVMSFAKYRWLILFFLLWDCWCFLFSVFVFVLFCYFKWHA